MSGEAWAELADDAETLARLHDRELDAATLAALREVGFPDNLALLPQTQEARDAWAAMRAALACIPAPPATTDLDALAAEYAAIYLTGAYGASPAESVWLDRDHLACQQPMFELREIYKAAGLAAENWRKRPDDHLVLQLHYIAHSLRRAAGADNAPAEADNSMVAKPDSLDAARRHFFPDALAHMLDAHLLRWLPDFAARVAARAAHPYHAALAQLTAVWCLSLRASVPRPR